MEALRIRGGTPLHGTIEISGAKNAVLPILAATVICGGKYVIHNCPEITDVTFAEEILRCLGGYTARVGKTLTVDTRGLCDCEIPGVLMCSMRASVLFLGPLLARFGRAVLTMPGGCPLGRRPIDLHLDAVSQMGAAITLQDGSIRCEAPRLHGCTVELPFPSVGATENALMAAVACRGTVTLRNAAREPEIGDLICFLRAMGADIRGIHTDTLVITGGLSLHDADHRVMPDRVETATWLCAAAGCGGNITLQETDGRLLLPVLSILEQSGCSITRGESSLQLQADGLPEAVGCIETAPYPGFPTDAQAVMMAALLRARGCTRFSETVFERRMGHVAQFRRMGADIETAGATAVVRGVEELLPARVCGCDLRAAAAMVVAALQIPGETLVTGVKHLRRGYDNPEKKLRALGADISLCNNSTGNFL